MPADGTVQGSARGYDPASAVVSAGILCSFAVLVLLGFSRNVNWDEFYFLSHVHAWLDGRLDRPMQTFFVHGFGWLARVPGTEVDQIAAARLVMVAFVAATFWAIWRIGARIADPESGRVAVLAYLASGFVLAHGASFRADPIAAGLLMVALALMITSRMRAREVAAVAVLCALAPLVTVKSVLYLPAFLGALAYRWPDRAVFLRCLGAGGLALGLAAVLYLLHASAITVAPANATATNAREAVGTSLLSGVLFPRWNETLLWALLSFPALVLAGVGLGAAEDVSGSDLSRERRPPHRLVLLALAAPLLVVVVYRNAFPYFFPFITPPLMILVAIGASGLRRQGRLAPLLAAMLALAAVQTVLALREGNAAQRATLAEVHRLFPAPAPYIDQHGMVSSFPKTGFFMSTWGIESYLSVGQPVFAALIAESRPPLLLANRDELAFAVRHGASQPGALLPEDQAALSEAYVHHAGAIWLAGRSLTGTGEPLSLGMPIAGRYRLEAAGPVTLDGVAVAPGARLDLGTEGHRLIAAPGMAVRLVWDTAAGDAAPPDLPEDGLYSGFWRF